MGSAVATREGLPGLADYAATKAAIVGYTKGAARDLAPRHITVNVVQPGAVDTEMAPVSGPFADVLHTTTALGRYGRPEEIAAAIVFSPARGHRISPAPCWRWMAATAPNRTMKSRSNIHD